jgi:hypothetical protein
MENRATKCCNAENGRAMNTKENVNIYFHKTADKLTAGQGCEGMSFLFDLLHSANRLP